MKIFIQKWKLFRFFLSKIYLKTNECPTIHKVRSDDSLHMPDDSHYIHTHSIISFFHARWILVFAGIIMYVNASVTNTKMSSLTVLVCYIIKIKVYEMHFRYLFIPSLWNGAQIYGYLTTSFYNMLPSKDTLISTAPATGPDSSVGRVSAPGNGRSRVRSRAATYQSRKKWY